MARRASFRDHVLGVVRRLAPLAVVVVIIQWLEIGALALTTWFAPRFILALAYDLGGVATSDVTVPVITALGVALAAALGSGNGLLDGFGLVALASLCPILVVLTHALVTSGRRSGRADR